MNDSNRRPHPVRAPEHCAPERGVPERAAPERGAPERCTAAYGAAERRVPDDPWIGRLIGDEFLLVERIGAGVQGVVYRAVQRHSGRPVAVKILTGEKARDPQYRLRFLREAQALELLRHPSIVKLLRYGTIRGAGGGLYLAEALVEGVSLEHVIDTTGPLDPARVIHIGLQVLDALAEAHRHGVVHRDIKPAHIMLSPSPDGERVTLIDFGLARRDHGFDDDDEATPLTRVGALLGSPLYMAPEPLVEAVAGPAADQYSLGTVLFEMLSGKAPFGGTLESLLVAHACAPTPTLAAALDPTGGWSRLIARAMAKDPTARFPDPAAMSAALGALAPLYDQGDTLVEVPSVARVSLRPEGAADETRPRNARRSKAAESGAKLILLGACAGLSMVLGSAAALVSIFL